MRKTIFHRVSATLLALVVALGFFGSFVSRTVKADISANATVINCNNAVNVREYPTNQSRNVGSIALNERIQVTGSTMASSTDQSDLSTWYSINYNSNGEVKSGYVAAYYVRLDPSSTGASDSAFESSIADFPESYKPYLRDMHNAHPSWQFVPVYTGVDFNTAVGIETRPGGSLISNSCNGSWKSKADYAYNAATNTYTVVDASNWVNASAEIVSFYMDPRNSLNETAVFQFLDLTYTVDNSIPSSHVQGILPGTFLNTSAANQNGDVINYCDIFADAGNIADVNPIFLAAHAIQECSKGGSNSSRGTNGYYNLFNIGAYSSATDATVIGLNFAQNGLSDSGFNSTYMIPWDTPGKAIVGGAMWMRDNYIWAGQGTLYFMRFNFDPASSRDKGYHQYMTATASVYTEAARMQTAYIRSGLYDSGEVFRIPVFDNMPSSAVALPPNEIAAPSSGTEWVGRDGVETFLIYLYRSTLSRDPDAAGINYWYNNIKINGMSGEDVAYGFVFSQEMTNRNLSNEQYVRILYNAFLGRECDADGLNYWLDRLSSGSSRLDVYHGFSRSAEFAALCTNAGFSPY